jgi:hypothetical protein
VLAGAGVFLAAALASATTILDDYDTGPVTLSSPSFQSVNADTQVGLDPAHVFSGERSVEVRGGTLDIASSVPGRLFLDGVPNDFGLVGVRYAPAAPFDLTAGGNELLELVLSDVSGVLQWSMSITDADALVGAVLRNALEPPVQRILLAEFTAQGIDVSRVVGIEFTIVGSAVDVGIEEFRAAPIPEPSTVLLLGLGLLGLGAVGRRSSSSVSPLVTSLSAGPTPG